MEVWWRQQQRCETQHYQDYQHYLVWGHATLPEVIGYRSIPGRGVYRHIDVSKQSIWLNPLVESFRLFMCIEFFDVWRCLEQIIDLGPSCCRPKRAGFTIF